jgi:hypothetical protein
VQDHAADQLDVVVPLAQHPLGGLAHHGEGFVQQLVEGLALGQAFAEFDGLGAQLLVGERLIFGSSAVIFRRAPARP